jgi:hypothetical protein
MNIETKVVEVFNLYPETKDDDNLLFAYFLQEFQEEFDFLTEDEMYFIKNFIIKFHIATLFSTLRRTRQKLQEHNEKYRGVKWYEGQFKAEEMKQFYSKN